MHHQFASKFLLDTLHSQGFCASYSEVKRFEVCAAKTQGTDIPGLQAGHFVQYIADNADHNVNTIDGYNTFHGMGIIAAITPGIKSKLHISRDVASNEEIAELGKIDIKFFKSSPLANLPLTYHDLGDLSCDDPTWKMDLLWKVVWPLRSPRPGWTGLMQTVAKGKYPGKSSIAYMPMMDMKATDMSCVYSTLHFVCKQARAQNVTPILTFDQPLWWKAQIIIQNEPSNSELKNIVLRLGGFHTEMSYLGCIGHIMRGSGLQELMEVVYAPNTVMHMLSGKALSRAVRGHFLVNSALNALLVQKAFSSHHTVSKQDLTSEADAEQMCQSDEIATTESATQHPSLDQEESHTEELDCDLGKTLSLFDQLLHDEASCDDICQDEALNRVHIKLQDQMSALSSSRTATLWLQYMDMVDLLRIFIKSERTGHWLLHLCTLRRMLPFFASTGHNLYAKSVHIYLQEMLHLEERHPEVYAMFESGFHVIRRSDRFWAGLSSDLVIEQTLMRNMKTSGGLTRGRGMSDSQRTQWLFSMPACADINDAMQEFTGTSYVTSDQHKDMTIARQKRDDNDTYKLLAFLQERDPFTSDMPLHNITTGVTAGNTVNADKGLEIGNSILKSMVGKQVFEHSFKKKDQVITMDNKSSVKIDGDVINVDSQLLFQRLVTAAQRNTEDISGIFEYELSTLPSSLFEPSGVMRAANKPALAEALWKAGKGPEVLLPQDETMVHVLDGGSLLHKIPWPRNVTFSAILKMYIDYVSQKFPNPILVFDGYDTGPSTKDVAHMKRSKGMIAPEVIFVEDMPIATRKDHFLANPSNKQRFINMLSKKLEEKNYKTVHARGVADLLIVQTAVESASSRPTTVIGEDTDLLVLLCFHAEPTSLGLYFKSEGKTMIKKQRIWNITQLKVNLGSDICYYLPFVHAVGGCDTTSRLFGIGKGVVLKKLLNDSYFRQKVHLFCIDQTRENIMTAGEAIIVCLYNGLPGESLDSLRYRRFSEKVATSSSYVQVHSLPPTSAAARYHNARVYLQIKEWMGTSLDPEDWGWIKTGDKLEPRTTDKPPAPDTLLRVIRCNCKTECGSRRCICRRHGLECSVACGQCRGVACSNAMCILTDVVNGDN